MKETIIYIRTSTEEQNPENQLKDCEVLALKLGLNNYEVLSEQASAFKDIEREVFNSIKERIAKGEIKNLIIWDFDRLFRNRINTIEFIRNYSKLGLKVYSVRQDWFQEIEKIPEPFNDIMKDLMLQVVGWIAEEESKKKSERVKLAVVRKDKEGNPIKTISYKGNKWGRKTIITKRLMEDIIRLKGEGKSYRDIQKLVHYYDKNGNLKTPSLALVFYVLNKDKAGNPIS